VICDSATINSGSLAIEQCLMQNKIHCFFDTESSIGGLQVDKKKWKSPGEARKLHLKPIKDITCPHCLRWNQNESPKSLGWKQVKPWQKNRDIHEH
jgi:hypothetical protein